MQNKFMDHNNIEPLSPSLP